MISSHTIVEVYPATEIIVKRIDDMHYELRVETLGDAIDDHITDLSDCRAAFAKMQKTAESSFDYR